MYVRYEISYDIVKNRTFGHFQTDIWTLNVKVALFLTR